MSTQLTTETGRHQKNQHYDQPTTSPTTPARRVSLPDRIALHLGVALITWSRRPRRSSPRPLEGSALPHEARLERIRVEAEAARFHARTYLPR